MASNDLHFNESKTEIMVFSPNLTNKSLDTDRRPLRPNVKSTAKNLGEMVDREF